MALEAMVAAAAKTTVIRAMTGTSLKERQPARIVGEAEIKFACVRKKLSTCLGLLSCWIFVICSAEIDIDGFSNARTVLIVLSSETVSYFCNRTEVFLMN